MLIAVISYVYNHRSRIIILEIKHRINENEKRKEMIEKICWRIEKETTRKENKGLEMKREDSTKIDLLQIFEILFLKVCYLYPSFGHLFIRYVLQL